MDRMDHIARLGVPAEAGARPKCEQLRTLDRRGIVPDQDQSSRRTGVAELPDLGELPQGADIEDRHVWTVGPQHDGDSPLLDVGGDDHKTWIALDQSAQSSGKE